MSHDPSIWERIAKSNVGSRVPPFAWRRRCVCYWNPVGGRLGRQAEAPSGLMAMRRSTVSAHRRSALPVGRVAGAPAPAACSAPSDRPRNPAPGRRRAWPVRVPSRVRSGNCPVPVRSGWTASPHAGSSRALCALPGHAVCRSRPWASWGRSPFISELMRRMRPRCLTSRSAIRWAANACRSTVPAGNRAGSGASEESRLDVEPEAVAGLGLQSDRVSERVGGGACYSESAGSGRRAPHPP